MECKKQRICAVILILSVAISGLFGIPFKGASADSVLYGSEAVYQNNLSVFMNQRSDDRMMEYLLIEPDNEYAYKINDEIREVCREITKDCVTDMEKLHAIHDWVCTNLYYESYQGTGVGAIYTFYHRGTRCEGYADLTAALCREAGIPCKEMEGFGIGSFIEELQDKTIEEIFTYCKKPENMMFSHMWNEAWVDGRWVLLDTTWDSHNANSASNPEVTYSPCTQKYFDMNIEQFSKTHLFATYISYFETKFDEWNQKNTNPSPSAVPGIAPTPSATVAPTMAPTPSATAVPSIAPTPSATAVPSIAPASGSPIAPTVAPTETPSYIDDNHDSVSSLKKPAKVTGLFLKNKKGKKLVVKWNWQVSASGFQVQYALNKSFSKGQKKKRVGEYTNSLTLKLKKKKTYYVRVRAFKKKDGEGVYGAWSTVKKIKIKK